MHADEIDLLRTSLRHVMTAAGTTPLADRLDELGWDEAVAEDRPTTLRILFEVKGEELCADDALDTVLCEVLTGSDGVVVIPRAFHADADSSVGADGSARLRGVTLRRPRPDETLVATADHDGQDVLLSWRVTDRLNAHPVSGLDPDLGVHEIDVTVPSSEVVVVGGSDATRRWGDAEALGRWLLAAELVGVARRTLEAATDYAGARHQYGRPIGSFQAVQHRLADAAAAVAGAECLVRESSVSESHWDAMVAKAYAGRAAESACRQAQQVYGAIGFTWEHDFHRHLRRTYLLDRLLGDWRTLQVEIGRELEHTQRVPRVGAL